MSWAKKAFRFVDRGEEVFNVILLLSATGIIFVNVILRYFFSASTTWAEEVTRYLIVYVSFVGGSIGVRQGEHVGIDLIYQLVPETVKRILSSIMYLVAMLFTAILAYYGWRITYFTFATGQISPTIMIPIWIVYLSMPAGSLLMSIRFLQKFWIEVTRFKSKNSRDLE